MGNMCGGGKDTKSGNDKPRLIFVVGGPGSGKGTQCEQLVNKHKFEHLSTGDLLRAEVKSGSEKGKELQKTMSEGGLVTTKDLLELLEAEMNKKGWGKCQPFLIDGFPRNEENVTVFGEMLKDKITLLGVLNFEVSEEEMKRRCLGRGQGRADDNEETILKRLATFQNETVPTIAKLKDCGNVFTVDSSKAKEEVTALTIETVNKMLGNGEAKKEEAPKQEAPVEEAPKQEAPVEEEKKEEAPVEEEKKEEAPVEEEKKEEAPVEEEKKEEAPVEEEKKEEAPAE